LQQLYFGEALDSIKKVILSGFTPGQTLRNNFSEAMMDSRNCVGFNKLYKPAVMVLQVPSSSKLIMETESGFMVVKKFAPISTEIILCKIDFRSPQFIKMVEQISPIALIEMEIGRLSNI